MIIAHSRVAQGLFNFVVWLNYLCCDGVRKGGRVGRKHPPVITSQERTGKCLLYVHAFSTQQKDQQIRSFQEKKKVVQSLKGGQVTDLLSPTCPREEVSKEH